MSGIISSGSYVENRVAYTASITNDLEWFVNEFRPHFTKWVYDAINRLVANDPLIGFIFMSCVIDYLAGFMAGSDSTGKLYESFIRKYFPTGKYNSKELYKSLRCGLVHSFTIIGKKYVLNSGHPEQHLKKTDKGHTILNATNFRDDLLTAAEKFFDHVINDQPSLAKLIQRYKGVGFMDFGPITVKM